MFSKLREISKQRGLSAGADELDVKRELQKRNPASSRS